MKPILNHIILTMLCCMVGNSIALAGTFNVFPTRLELEDGAKIGSVTVVNNNDKKVNMQVRAMAWMQGENGRDFMQDSDGLTFYPKIFSIPPHSKKVVRVGYQSKTLNKEISFRLFIRELPVDEPGSTGMKMAIQISMPVFIRPHGADKIPLPEVQGISILDGKLVGWLENTGNRYLMAKKLELNGSKAGKNSYTGAARGWYVLAGVKKAFLLGLSRKDCNAMDRLKINAVTDHGHKAREFAVSPTLCSEIVVKKPAKSKATEEGKLSS